MTGTRYSLITFAPEYGHLNRLERHMPLMRSLRVQASLSFHAQHHVANGYPADPVEWAVAVIQRAKRAGYRVYWGPFDGAADFGLPVAEYVRNVLALCNVAGVVLDAEWSDPQFAVGGWRGYVDFVQPLITECRRAVAPAIGPGPTHSDPDEELECILAAARFDAGSFHLYFDKGWPEAIARANRMRDVFARHGYDPDLLMVTETGVTGQCSKSPWFVIGPTVYGDGLISGTADERLAQRYGHMKALYDTGALAWVDEAMLYQYGEDGTAEAHGSGFGHFRSDGTFKSLLGKFWRSDG